MSTELTHLYYRVHYSHALAGPAEGQREILHQDVRAQSDDEAVRNFKPLFPSHADVHIERVEPSPMRRFEVREGDGNMGTFRRGTVEAPDAFLALEAHFGPTPDDAMEDGDGDRACWSTLPPDAETCDWVAEAIGER